MHRFARIALNTPRSNDDPGQSVASVRSRTFHLTRGEVHVGVNSVGHRGSAMVCSLLGCFRTLQGQLNFGSSLRQATLRFIAIVVGLGASFPSTSADYTSPTSALKSLEAAYAAKDIEAAVAARDFAAEAKEMILLISKGDTTISGDPGILKQTAEVLEKGFRVEMKKKGFPSIATLRCEMVEQPSKRPDLVPILETCIWPNNSRSVETVHAIKTLAGWKIISMPSDRA
jgi:hypothetical protein